MAEQLPDDWSIPTFREIAEDPTMFGVEPHHFTLAVFLGSMPSLVLIFAAKMAHSAMAFLYAGIMAFILIPALLFMFRYLRSVDKYWFEGLTSHRFPAVRYLGK